LLPLHLLLLQPANVVPNAGPDSLPADPLQQIQWYHPFSDAEKADIEEDVHRQCTSRDLTYTSFVEYKSYKLVSRRYAGLFFVFGVDLSDNELLVLESIHLFVEILDHYFENVCELDLVFGFHKAYCILDEFIIGGEVQETSKKVILARLQELDRLDT
jgi:AP-2 complex subunit sigma-1